MLTHFYRKNKRNRRSRQKAEPKPSKQRGVAFSKASSIIATLTPFKTSTARLNNSQVWFLLFFFLTHTHLIYISEYSFSLSARENTKWKLPTLVLQAQSMCFESDYMLLFFVQRPTLSFLFLIPIYHFFISFSSVLQPGRYLMILSSWIIISAASWQNLVG